MSQTIRLLIVDDHPLYRQGVCLFLSAHPELTLVAEAESGEKALEFLAEHEIDVVLMDLQMPAMDGIEVTRAILARWPQIRILILSGFSSWDRVFTALKCGASGYVMKSAEPDELLAAIKGVMAGGRYLGTGVATILVDQLVDQDSAPASPASDSSTSLIEPLTGRELDVLREMVNGLSNQEIASALSLSINTVKTHTSNIFQKLQVSSRNQAILYAMKHNLL